MNKSRVPVTKHAREHVLAEFHHRCAICGADRPQIHHIDENPANNELANLLPLCPNCHLIDQHNPTAPADPAKLRLFRRYKDPVILSPEFHPLFRRLLFLIQLDPESDFDSIRAASVELIAFVAVLKMGQFYHVRIADLVTDSSPWIAFTDEPDDVTRARSNRQRQDYHAKLQANQEKAIDLIVEMLRYQDWTAPRRVHRTGSEVD